MEGIMTALPEVPGIIEGAMTITPEPDGRISFRVLLRADGERADRCDRIELIISPEHVRQALAADGDLGAFPCHIGFSRNSVRSAP